jgi:hypothetical protein
MTRRGPKPGDKRRREEEERQRQAAAAPTPLEPDAGAAGPAAPADVPPAETSAAPALVEPDAPPAADPNPTSPADPQADPPAPPLAAEPELNAWQKENPTFLSGAALRELAHRRGLSLSEMDRMDDDKVRQQLRILEAHRSEELETAVG